MSEPSELEASFSAADILCVVLSTSASGVSLDAAGGLSVWGSVAGALVVGSLVVGAGGLDAASFASTASAALGFDSAASAGGFVEGAAAAAAVGLVSVDCAFAGSAVVVFSAAGLLAAFFGFGFDGAGVCVGVADCDTSEPVSHKIFRSLLLSSESSLNFSASRSPTPLMTSSTLVSPLSTRT